jgi:DNA modification methylase
MQETETILNLNTQHLLERLQQLQQAESLDTIRCLVATLQTDLASTSTPLHMQPGTLEDEESHPPLSPTSTTSLKKTYLDSLLDQIARARTCERSRYYIERLIKSITEVKTSPINDINLNRWQEYDDIKTDSLWILDEEEDQDINDLDPENWQEYDDIKTESLWIEPRRDNSGVHTAGYWGNFIPQIPRQMMLRYTRKGDWVLDTFAGCGTTLIEGQRLGRNTIGIELQPDVAEQTKQRIAAELNLYNVVWDIVTGDSTITDYQALIQQYGQQQVQLVIMHPPYFDIIKFSEDPRDLANAASLEDFLHKMGTIVERVAPILERKRYLVVVIGDKYARGEWIPLGFYTMQTVMQRGFTLKSIIVKNFEQTTGKRNQKELWRYRALRGGYYIFKHEYIFLFQKE